MWFLHQRPEPPVPCGGLPVPVLVPQTSSSVWSLRACHLPSFRLECPQRPSGRLAGLLHCIFRDLHHTPAGSGPACPGASDLLSTCLAAPPTQVGPCLSVHRHEALKGTTLSITLCALPGPLLVPKAAPWWGWGMGAYGGAPGR